MRNERKILFLLLSVFLVLMFAACGRSAASADAEPMETAAQTVEESSVPESADTDTSADDQAAVMTASQSAEAENGELTTINKGKLTVAASTEMRPYEFYADVNGKSELAGIEVSLVKYIADRLDLELELLPMSGSEAMDAISKGKADLAIVGLSPNPMIADFMDFSDVYYVGGQSFVTLQKSVGNFEDPEMINNFNRKIGVRKASPQFVFLKQSAPNAYVVQRNTTAEVIEDLLGSAIDGAFLDYSEANYYVKQYPEIVDLYDSDFGQYGSSLAVMKGNTALAMAVNESLREAREDGSLDQFIVEAYGLSASQPPEAAS